MRSAACPCRGGTALSRFVQTKSGAGDAGEFSGRAWEAGEVYGRDRARAKGSASGSAIWSVRFFALKGKILREDGMRFDVLLCQAKWSLSAKQRCRLIVHKPRLRGGLLKTNKKSRPGNGKRCWSMLLARKGDTGSCAWWESVLLPMNGEGVSHGPRSAQRCCFKAAVFL